MQSIYVKMFRVEFRNRKLRVRREFIQKYLMINYLTPLFADNMAIEFPLH
jgi:hypothetical protein